MSTCGRSPRLGAAFGEVDPATVQRPGVAPGLVNAEVPLRDEIRGLRARSVEEEPLVRGCVELEARVAFGEGAIELAVRPKDTNKLFNNE